MAARPTAPLPPAVSVALSRVEARLAYRRAAERARCLAAVAASGRMTDLDARSLAEAEADMAAALGVLGGGS